MPSSNFSTSGRTRPRGPTVKAPDYESGDCAFDSRRGQLFVLFPFPLILRSVSSGRRNIFAPEQYLFEWRNAQLQRDITRMRKTPTLFFQFFFQVLSHNPEFKFKSSGQKLLLTVHSLLYDLPTLKNRDLPKCKSQASRMAGYTCLIEITKHAPDNFISLGRLLLKDELERSCQLWDYWPRDDTRADCGYVGINNLGMLSGLCHSI